MPFHLIARTLPFWLIAAALQGPAYGFATKSKADGQLPAAPTLASLPPSSAQQPSSGEPFDELAVPVASGDVPDRWHVIQTEIAADISVLDRCLAGQECPTAARAFLDIVAQGRDRNGMARIGQINQAVNLAVTPTSDMRQWGVSDRWSSPLETLTSRRGDCEDYAIAKYVALIEAGVAKADVRLVIVHDRFPQEDHAVVAARVAGAWLILDNRSHALIPPGKLRGATPLFVLDDSGARIFVPGIIGGDIS